MKGPLKRMVPNASPGGRQTEFVVVHENSPITTPSGVEGVYGEVTYKINVSAIWGKPSRSKLTFWTTCTRRLEPGETVVPLAGKPMWTHCAKHVVVKAASKAAIDNVKFMVVAIREISEFIDSLYFFIKMDKNNIDIGDVITFLFFNHVKARGCPPMSIFDY